MKGGDYIVEAVIERNKNREVLMDLVTERVMDALKEKDELLLEGVNAIIEDDEILSMV